jgi:heat shock transcription factor
MYGFHKRVGLSDNSMKASERKNKSPSEYYNPYFRRGHPNLLWLINKPKSGNSKKKGKKDEADVESEEDGVEEAYSGPSLAASQPGRGPVSNELGPLQKKDLVQVRSQIERLQQQQVAISSMLTKMRQDQNQLYQQAVLFQNMHERHENSINAILNFLANVFRKSLEEQGGTQTVQDLLASIIPNAQGHAQTQIPTTGGVVDLGGFVNQRAQNVPTAGTPKRQPRLLPPIPHHQASKVSSLSSASTAPTPSPQPSHQAPQMGTVTELFDPSPSDTTSPSYIKNELRSNPQEGMMKIIQDTNAVNNTSGFDLPGVAAKTPASMSDDQRAQMLNIMAGSSSNLSIPPITTTTNTMPTAPAVPLPNPTTPTTLPPTNPNLAGNPATGGGGGLSLSPNLSSLQMPSMPSLHEIQTTQAELEALQRLQSEQADQIDALTHLLGPLSPSGRIPGLDEHGQPRGESYFDSVDYEQYLHPAAFGGEDGGVGVGGGGSGGGGGWEGWGWMGLGEGMGGSLILVWMGMLELAWGGMVVGDLGLGLGLALTVTVMVTVWVLGMGVLVVLVVVVVDSSREGCLRRRQRIIPLVRRRPRRSLGPTLTPAPSAGLSVRGGARSLGPTVIGSRLSRLGVSF